LELCRKNLLTPAGAYTHFQTPFNFSSHLKAGFSSISLHLLSVDDHLNDTSSLTIARIRMVSTCTCGGEIQNGLFQLIRIHPYGGAV
jgi:hypothetical protein